MDRLQQLAHQCQDLIDAFGKDVGTALYHWALQQGTHVKGLRRVSSGKTAASVFTAYEQPAEGPARKLVVKLCPAEDDTGVLREPGRHLEALRLDGDFARRHLVKLAYDPVPVGDAWVLFQHIAGANQRGVRPLSVLLENVVRRHQPSKPSHDLKALTSVCRALVRSLLGDWAPHRVESMDVTGFLGLNLDGRLGPTGSLRRWLEGRAPYLLDPSEPWISLPGADRMLPNPITLATDPEPSRGLTVWALVGPGHGDEHQDNVLVPTRQVRKASDFWLIDLSRFSPDAPLTRGPVHLLLSIVAAYLDDLSSSERDALVPFLVDPGDDSGGIGLPLWLGQVVGAIRNTAQAWADQVGFGEEWEAQTLLSLVATALIFTGRRTTAELHRDWFLRLAAEAGLAHINRQGGHRAGYLLSRPVPEAPVETTSAAPRPLASQLWTPDGRSRETVVPGPSEDPSSVHPWTSSPARLPLGVTSLSGAPMSSRNGASTRRRRVVHSDLLLLADHLGEQVLDEWSAVADGRRLVVPGPIPVRWVRSARPVVGPIGDAGVTAESLARGAIADLLPLYCDLRPGRLVIVGRPGSGKSAASIQLVRDVLQYRRQLVDREERAAVAVPVLLTPLDWDPLRQPVKKWLVQRLMADYVPLRILKHGPEMARRLVDAGLVALVLDGLDDMREPERVAALRALDEQARLRMVVVGRSDEMVAAAAGGHLSAAVAVELQPVEPDEAADYLERCAVDPLPPGWRRLVEEVRSAPTSPAAQALDSPLMLGLVRDTYGQRPDRDRVDELLDSDRFGTRQAVEDHLVSRVLPVAYAPRPGVSDPPYSLSQAERWLVHMARQMHRNNSRDLAWWCIPDDLSPWRRLLGVGLVSGLLSGLMFAGLGWLEGEPALGFLGGFPLGPAATLFNELVIRRAEHPYRRVIGRWIAAGYVLATLVTGLLSGILLAGADDGVMPGAVVGLGVGIIAGIPFATQAVGRLAFSVRPAAKVGSPLTPAACWRQDLRHSAVFGALVGALVGVTTMLVCLLLDEPAVRILGAVTIEVAVMPPFAFVFSASAKTTLAAVQLWLQGRCPVRLVRFLEDARERNVLRTAGAVYQFRHARLQDVLAGEDATSRGAQPQLSDRSSKH